MTTEIQIGWREWRDWDELARTGAIQQLNRLLAPHGVRLEKRSGRRDDCLGLRAVTTPRAADQTAPAGGVSATSG